LTINKTNDLLAYLRKEPNKNAEAIKRFLRNRKEEHKNNRIKEDGKKRTKRQENDANKERKNK
jgi:hypothetical protein